MLDMPIINFLGGSISLQGIVFFLLTAQTLYLAKGACNIWMKIFFNLAFIIQAIVLLTHRVPGVENALLINSAQISDGAYPFTLYFNFDKTFLGYLIIFMLGMGSGRFSVSEIIKSLLTYAFPLLLSILILSMALGFVQFDPKIPSQTLLFLFYNLFFVSLAEEAFFRRYLQDGLETLFSRSDFGKWIALILTSFIFGLAYHAGGTTYMLLSAIAGLFYGMIYLKTRRLESAILLHFTLNTVHFFFFTYPALMPAVP